MSGNRTDEKPDVGQTPTAEAKPSRRKKAIKIAAPLIFFALIPAVLAGCMILFQERSVNIAAPAAALLACVPFFLRFEKGEKNSRELVIVAVMTGISVLGRFLFAPMQGFKPVTAIVIIAAICLGSETGFMIGALTAVVSNFYFGQGLWTPFQMISWGGVGFFAGLLPRFHLTDGKTARILSLSAAGIVGGVVFSLTTDVMVPLSAAAFSLSLYGEAVLAALPWMALYAASNVVFLLVLARPISEKLQRIKTKYGVFPDTPR
jgi:uncharacterized membrane protein